MIRLAKVRVYRRGTTVRNIATLALLCVLWTTATIHAAGPQRHAVIIGINDYADPAIRPSGMGGLSKNVYENRSMGILPMSSTGILPVAKTHDQHGLEGRATHGQDARATANAGFHTRSKAKNNRARRTGP